MLQLGKCRNIQVFCQLYTSKLKLKAAVYLDKQTFSNIMLPPTITWLQHQTYFSFNKFRFRKLSRGNSKFWTVWFLKNRFRPVRRFSCHTCCQCLCLVFYITQMVFTHLITMISHRSPWLLASVQHSCTANKSVTIVRVSSFQPHHFYQSLYQILPFHVTKQPNTPPHGIVEFLTSYYAVFKWNRCKMFSKPTLYIILRHCSTICMCSHCQIA